MCPIEELTFLTGHYYAQYISVHNGEAKKEHGQMRLNRWFVWDLVDFEDDPKTEKNADVIWYWPNAFQQRKTCCWDILALPPILRQWPLFSMAGWKQALNLSTFSTTCGKKLSSGAQSGESPVTSCSSFSVCLSTSCHITPSAGTRGACWDHIWTSNRCCIRRVRPNRVLVS